MTEATKHALDNDRKRLLQEEMLSLLRGEQAATEMVTVYLSDRNEPHNYGVYCALVPSAMIEDCLMKSTWDLSHGDGAPGAVIRHDGKRRRTKYLRFGNDTGVEPLVIDREFGGLREDYKEICEEFRLFHGLFHNRKTDEYVKVSSAGDEELIAVVERDRVCIRLKEIRQFLAIKEMHLAIQFDCREHSFHKLDDLGLKEGSEQHRDGLSRWDVHYGEFGGISSHESFSRLLGKHLIAPVQKKKSGFWGFAEEEQKKYVDFIIGVDQDGDEITHTSNPDKLANYFGANPKAPNYLTVVHFRREVLDKYFQQPSKYSVEDSYLRCGHLWGIALDNHHRDKVCAWLGDLGRDLPYSEQLHWRAQNIPPMGTLSSTFFRRQILAEFATSDMPEHTFTVRYAELAQECDERLGWRLLAPLDQGDEHYFQGVRVPAREEQRDFDELVLGLSKVLIDSVNEEEIKKLLEPREAAELKGGIARLEAVFVRMGVAGTEDHISFMRKLQNLRSSGAAHRKGRNYRKIAAEFDVAGKDLRSVAGGILDHANSLLQFLTETVHSGRLNLNRTT